MFSDIPFNALSMSSKSGLPFDIEEYVKERFNEEINPLKNKIEYEKSTYMSFHNELLKKFTENTSKVTVELARHVGGLRSDDSVLTMEMQDRAIKNFFHVLITKGYTYTQQVTEEQIEDPWDDSHHKVSHITINIKH